MDACFIDAVKRMPLCFSGDIQLVRIRIIKQDLEALRRIVASGEVSVVKLKGPAPEVIRILCRIVQECMICPVIDLASVTFNGFANSMIAAIWCMAEISEFKAAHDGSISHILPVLVSGDPAVSIPAELRSGTVAVVNADGSVTLERNRVVEPLCADVRGEDTRAILPYFAVFRLRDTAGGHRHAGLGCPLPYVLHSGCERVLLHTALRPPKSFQIWIPS